MCLHRTTITEELPNFPARTQYFYFIERAARQKLSLRHFGAGLWRNGGQAKEYTKCHAK
jgi:hypothetical protein